MLGLLSSAGWEDVKAETVALDLLPGGDPREFAVMQTQMGGASFVIKEKEATDAQKEAIRDELEQIYAQAVHAGEIKIPASIHFFTARA